MALAQVNATVGALEANAALVIDTRNATRHVAAGREKIVKA